MHSDGPNESPSLTLDHRYDIATEHLEISGHHFTLQIVRDVNTLLDAITPDQFNEDERLPFWAELWPSSIALAAHCLAMDLRGRRVLELGCGLGLAGIAAAKAGATVVMTDYEPDALEFSRRNVLANLTSEQTGNVSFRLMDWRSWPTDERFEMIIGADVVYDRANFAPLRTVLQSSIAEGGIVVLADPGRSIGRDFFGGTVTEDFALTNIQQTVDHRGKSSTIDLFLLRSRRENAA